MRGRRRLRFRCMDTLTLMSDLSDLIEGNEVSVSKVVR
jgi:hypothetical protein